MKKLYFRKIGFTLSAFLVLNACQHYTETNKLSVKEKKTVSAKSKDEKKNSLPYEKQPKSTKLITEKKVQKSINDDLYAKVFQNFGA